MVEGWKQKHKMPKCSQFFWSANDADSNMWQNAGCRTTESNTPQAEVLRLRAENLQLSQHLDRSEGEVTRLHARCNFFSCVILSPHSVREMKYIIRLSWSGCIWKKNQPETAAPGRGADDTTLIESVEPSSFAALVGLVIDKRHQKVPMFTWKSTNDWWKILFQSKRKQNNLSSKHGEKLEISVFGEWTSEVQFPQVHVVRQKQWLGFMRLSPLRLLMSWRRQKKSLGQRPRQTSRFLSEEKRVASRRSSTETGSLSKLLGRVQVVCRGVAWSAVWLSSSVGCSRLKRSWLKSVYKMGIEQVGR